MPTDQETLTEGRLMRVLVAEDNPIARAALEKQLGSWGYAVISVADGEAAWHVLGGPDPPRLAIIDWGLPGVDGLEVCRRVRQAATDEPPYLIVLTGRGSLEDIVAGLESGADEYLTKPVEPAELQARLAERVRELEAARDRERHLQGLLPICAWCKKIRNDRNYWQRVEEYLGEHADVRFSHGICPDCARTFQQASGLP